MDSPIDALIEAYGGQCGLADAMGVHQTTVSKWRTGGYMPVKKMRKARELAEARGVEFDTSKLIEAAA